MIYSKQQKVMEKKVKRALFSMAAIVLLFGCQTTVPEALSEKVVGTWKSTSLSNVLEPAGTENSGEVIQIQTTKTIKIQENGSMTVSVTRMFPEEPERSETVSIDGNCLPTNDGVLLYTHNESPTKLIWVNENTLQSPSSRRFYRE